MQRVPNSVVHFAVQAEDVEQSWYGDIIEAGQVKRPYHIGILINHITGRARVQTVEVQPK